ELVEEAVFDDVHFVQVVFAPEVNAVVAGEAGFDHGVLAELALPADVPALDVAQVHTRLEVVDAGGERSGERIGRRGDQAGAGRETALPEEHAAGGAEIVRSRGVAHGGVLGQA